MSNNFQNAMKNRRSYYAIDSSSPISDEQVQQIVESAVMHVPSAFNSQSTRVVVLFDENHKKLWNITKDILRKIVAPDSFAQTEAKIDNCFASGHGTILFFEDQSVVEGLQNQFSAYKDNFPIWSEQTSGMHQWAVWTMLEDAGLGASLQHYNPLIDEEVAKAWNINPKWKLRAQMPFGTPVGSAGEKAFEPIEKRVLVFK